MIVLNIKKNIIKEIRNYYAKNIKKYYQQNKQALLDQQKKYLKTHSWLRSFHSLRNRCKNVKHNKYKYYGGKGIKALITKEEIKKLWCRDKAYLLKQPSIDRINNIEHYTYSNCRFIEMNENIRGGNYLC